MEKRIEISYLVVIFDLFSRYFFFSNVDKDRDKKKGGR